MDIVIVDDEPKIRNGLYKLLNAKENWNVVGVFEEAKIALKFLYENTVDVLITDIKMPEVSGLELIGKIREKNQEVSIIILSGYSNFSFAQKAIELGVTRYITKPTNPKELISILTRIEMEKDNVEETIEEKEQEVDNLLVKKATEYIEMNYSKKIALKDIASELYISPNYLSELFKRHMGQNLSEYIIEYRMLKALKLLGQLEYKISDVAEVVGFNDAKYFSSTFKKMYGVTPLEYRNGKMNK
ncbi:MAG: response regulator [Velocimicrobium sp.]